MNPFDAEIELAVYRAFLRLPSDRLPQTPFMLNSWTRVNNDRWFEVLKAEVLTACEYLEGRRDQPQPRQRTGALLRVLQQLKPLISAKDFAA
ncbi:hypothetical protein H6F86_21190 [Phormidium sp. FACHB-592]|uniref:Uncharacterized protein n=1 Tax=Stenomitos frigidus AS-A4 TaxID=2933935 RepID=A0ABV0KES8_9CYAN|nr:hypothetical protein [Phormidium sp. FACHB-592]MBD2076351.1 hypothetical protein [Phormidium sp. FACHB-592]